jgi:hypothetical protein
VKQSAAKEPQRLESAIVVQGRVIGPNGEPISGASVMFARGPVAVPDIAQITTSRGTFALAAPIEGNYCILVNAPGFARVEHNVEVIRGKTLTVEIALGERR